MRGNPVLVLTEGAGRSGVSFLVQGVEWSGTGQGRGIMGYSVLVLPREGLEAGCGEVYVLVQGEEWG